MKNADDIRKKYAPRKVSALTRSAVENEFDDHDREYLYILGDAFLQSGQIEKAQKIFQFVDHIFPGDKQARKCIAYTQLVLKNYDEALALALDIKSTKTDDLTEAAISLILARLYAVQGKMEEARQEMQEFIDLRKMHGKVEI